MAQYEKIVYDSILDRIREACAHAVYCDLSYNCAQYFQSLDRIHRVGGSEDKTAHYYFLQYACSALRVKDTKVP